MPVTCTGPRLSPGGWNRPLVDSAVPGLYELNSTGSHRILGQPLARARTRTAAAGNLTVSPALPGAQSSHADWLALAVISVMEDQASGASMLTQERGPRLYPCGGRGADRHDRSLAIRNPWMIVKVLAQL
jgi:hypothetical protein